MKMVFLSTLFMTSQYLLWASSHSVWHTLRVVQIIEVQKHANEQRYQRNQTLTSTLEGLTLPVQHRNSLTEEYARWHLGWIKPKETFYVW